MKSEKLYDTLFVMKNYVRKPLFDALWNALQGQPNLIQVVLGPRQVGKTTLALQVLDKWKGAKLYETADQPTLLRSNGYWLNGIKQDRSADRSEKKFYWSWTRSKKFQDGVRS